MNPDSATCPNCQQLSIARSEIARTWDGGSIVCPSCLSTFVIRKANPEAAAKMRTPANPISGKCGACIDYDVDFSECSRDSTPREQTDTCKHFEVEPDIQLNS